MVAGAGSQLNYQVPAATIENKYVVKKSRFIARLVPVTSREAVNLAVQQARDDYPDARHHCWAYLLGKPADACSAGMSDDGEPAGTAGRPILNVLQHGHLGDALIIVIRYFGGIKLGAGGLVRAYSSATQQVLDLAPVQTMRELLSCTAIGDFSVEQALRHFLAGVEGELLAVAYTEAVTIELVIAAVNFDALAEFCAAHAIELVPHNEVYKAKVS